MQADGPRLLSGSIRSPASVPPTENADGSAAGLMLVPALGPELPAAKIGTMVDDRSAARSDSNVRSHPAAIVQESSTTSGASLVAGLPSGSSSHWKPRWTPAAVATPWSLKIFTAIQRASGAIPIAEPPASPPTIAPIVHVPWPLTSVGVVVCSPLGSYQLFVPPRQRALRSGWLTSTPVSMFATTTPCPR